MVTRIQQTVILGAAFLFLGSASAEELVGGPYSIQPLSINGGGQTSTGGPYEIGASTAQPGGVGTVEQGPYTLEDGFWAAVLVAIATEGFNYDIAPDPIDGFIDARDLIGWVERIKAGVEQVQLLYDFGKFWQGPFP
jgi:hypothetical protein